MPSKTFPSLVVGLFAGLAVLSPNAARASQEFPAALQEAAGIPCVPTCTVCHGVTPGDAGSFQNRQLPKDIIKAGGLPEPHKTDQLKAAFAKYAMDPAHAAALASLKAGIDPQTGDSLCGPTYGCGASIAPQPAQGSTGTSPIWFAGLAMLIGAVARRFKQR